MRLNRYEKVILSAQGSRLFESALAGCSQVTRSAFHSKDVHQTTIWNTGANVIGPLFSFFVLWLFRKAKEQKIDCIYFLSRDGEILYKIAQVFLERQQYPFECRYLNVSREALFYPAIDRIGDFECSWLMDLSDDLTVTIEDIRKRLHIDEGTFQKVFDLRDFSSRKPLSSKELFDVCRILRSDAIHELVHHQVDVEFERVWGYLSQEGFGKNKRYAIVDIGWHGSIQYAMSKILRKAMCYPPDGVQGYYLGLSDQQWIYENDRIDPFLIYGHRQHLINNPLYCEVFAASMQARTIGYDVKEDRYLPKFALLNKAVINWGVELQHQSILKYVEEFCSLGCFKDEKIEATQNILGSLLAMFLMDPSHMEGQVYGTFPMSVRVSENELAEFAPSFTKGLPKTYWVSGSCARSNFFLGLQIWKIFQYNPCLMEFIKKIFLLKRKC